MDNRKPKYQIGTQFLKRWGKGRNDFWLETVIDILTTYNAAGDLVKISYLTEHELMGQTIKDEVCETTICRGIQELNKKNNL